MDTLETITDELRTELEAKNAARDDALTRSRILIRHCANAIRAMHCSNWDEALDRLATAQSAACELSEGVRDYPDLYHAGYTQDALKELVEAFATYALVRGESLPPRTNSACRAALT